MAIFKKNEPQAPKPRERPASTSRGAPADGAISIIGKGMSVIGDVSTEGIVRIEGEVRGTIRAGKAVILGQGGLIEGNVFTDDAVIGGSVNGSILAENRLELQATCSVEGEIHARPEHLKLEEGARFAGQVRMIDTPEAPEESMPSPFQGNSLAPAFASAGVSQEQSEKSGNVESSTLDNASEGTHQEASDEDAGGDQMERRKKA